MLAAVDGQGGETLSWLEHSLQRRGGRPRWSLLLVRLGAGEAGGGEADQLPDGKKVSIEGVARRTRLQGTMADEGVAGSALIQACEKAGVTIPRFVPSSKIQYGTTWTDDTQILLP